MAKITRDSFEFFGPEFQVRLVAQILVDTKFAESIIDIIDANYFHDEYMRIIVSTIKEAHETQDVIPDIGSLEFRLLSSTNNELSQKYALAQLKKIENASLNDGFEVQERAMKFCLQQELNKTIKKIQSIIDTGDISRYDECENLLKKALEHGINKDNSVNVLDNIDMVLADDYRKPIPTGIKGLDEVMDGGLSKGELGIILAPFGVGKTTMVTKMANTAKNLGYNVLQIFFEDSAKIIQRKHLACWSNISLSELSAHKEVIKKIIEEKSKEKGELKLKKFPSDGTTMPIIKQYIRKLISQGFRPDIVLLDYIDCVQPSKNFDDVYAGEGNVMRQFETMLYEFDIAGWTAVQGNRSSIGASVVEADQIGGSIKKGQIGHFIVSIAKTLHQKENGMATMAILKSRFGKDGIVFNDIKFDNGTVSIDMSEDSIPKSRSEYNKDEESSQMDFLKNTFAKKRKNTLESTNELPENNN